ncbi:hypothetical protein U0070_006669, partial [Myodes glareolus]
PGKRSDVVAIWDVILSDGNHKIEFEHGTTSGKRVVYVDGKEEIRKDWMFSLVGKETFCIGPRKIKATICILPVKSYVLKYILEIEGKSFKKYVENRSKTTNTWGEFVDDGTETHFSVGNHDCYIKAVSSGKRREGIIHTLIVDNREIPEVSHVDTLPPFCDLHHDSTLCELGWLALPSLWRLAKSEGFHPKSLVKPRAVMLEELPLLLSGLETLGPNPRAQETLTWAVTFRLLFSFQMSVTLKAQRGMTWPIVTPANCPVLLTTEGPWDLIISLADTGYAVSAVSPATILFGNTSKVDMRLIW